MDLQWWIGSVIVPIVCAFIGGLFGFAACKVKYSIKTNNSTKKKNKIKNRDGNIVNESPGGKIG